MPLRILQLNSARKYVGEAAHTLNLTEALRRAGHSVWLGLREGFETHTHAQARALDPLPFRFESRWNPLHDWADMARIAELIREHRIDVVHAHRSKEHWLAALAQRRLKRKIPVVRTRHLTRPLSAHLFNRWLARRTARMIVVSKAVEADVRSTKLYPDAHVALIPGGLDLERYARTGRREAVRAELKLDPDALVTACVARLMPIKGHDVLLRAWTTVHAAHPSAVLLLVGGGGRQEALAAQARAAKLEDRVRFLGRQDPRAVAGLLEAADAGVLASTGSEGFSRAVLEYMALALPVVGTTVGAIPDLVEPEISGKLVPPGDAEALGRALRDLLALPAEVRAAWGAAGRARAEAYHGYAAWVRAHERVYAEAGATGTGSTPS